MIDNKEIQRILDKLENLEDEVLAVELLKEFNRSSSDLGKLLLNLDTKLSHDEWKDLCNKAQDRLSDIVNKIDQY